MDKVVATDSQSVAVATHLPHGEVGVGHLGTGRDGSRTAVDGLHGVCIDIIRQTA